MIRRFLRWLVADLPQPLTASDLGRMGRKAQLSAAQSKMDAKHAQLREEMAGRG